MAVHQSGNVVLKSGDGGGTEVFATIADISDVTGSGKTLNINTDKFIGSDEPTKTPLGFDYSQVTFTLALDPDNAQHAALAADRDAKTLRNFQIVISTATLGTKAFSGYVVDMGQPSTSGGATLTTSVTIEVTTEADWA